MRKITFCCLILLFALTAQPGIAQQDDPFWQPSPAQLEQWRVVENVEPGAQITFWSWALSPNFDAYLAQVVANFEATYPEVEVVWQDQPWDQMQTAVRERFAEGNPPDVINISPSWIAEFAQLGLLTDMDAALSDYPEVRAQYAEGAWDTLNYDGVSYHIPWYLGLSNFLGYNTALLEELGLTPDDLPTTWAELAEFAAYVRSNSDTYALSLNFKGAAELNILQHLVYDNVPILDETGQAMFDTPEAAASMQVWVDMVSNDLIPYESLTDDHRQMVERFANEETVVIMVAPHMLRLVQESNPEVFAKLGIAPGITGESGANRMDVQSLVIPTATEYPNAALAFALFITNPEVQTAFSKEVSIFPSNLLSYEDPFFTEVDPENPLSIVRPLAYDYVVNAENRFVSLPNTEEVQQIVAIEQEAALLGIRSPEEALANMVRRINELLATQE